MATLTGKLVSETYKALLKMIDNDILTETEKQISDGYGQGTGIFIDDNGFIRAQSYRVTGGSSSQFLKGDGSLDGNTYLSLAAANALYLPIGSTTSAIAEGSRLYFTEPRVLSTVLTGFVSTSGTVTASDSILTAINKIWWNIQNGGGGGGGYVPYTGATQNLNLGTYGLISDYIQFNLAPTSIPTTAGTMSWNSQDGTADLKMGGGNVTLQVGQEELVRVVNKTGANLLEANYQAVRVSGAQGNRLKVSLAKADNDANSADTIGLVTETINNNLEGFVTSVGLVRDIDTTGDLQGETWADGEMVYLSADTAGMITNIKPQAPQHGVRMGYIVRAHKTQGQIYVKVDNGYELDELHNVLITEPVTQDILTYDETLTGGLWINRNIWTAIGATEVGKGFLSIPDADTLIPAPTKPRIARINLDNTVDAIEVGTQGYLPFYDDTDFYPDSPVFTDGTDVVIGGETPNGTNKLTVIGGIWGEELVLNGQFLLATNTIGGNYSFNIYDGTSWVTQMVLSKTNLVFNISGFEKMRLNSSGYLGIGTDTPTALIHAKGTTAYPKIKLDNASTSGGGMFSAYQNGTEIANFGVSGAWLLDSSSDVAIVATKAGQGIQFYTNGSNSEKMGINSDGNLFVGQTPTFVAGATQAIVRGKTGAGFLGVQHYDMSIKGSINTFNNVFQVGTSTFHSVAVIVEDTERARFNSGGRFLLGTTTDNTVDIFQANGSIIATAIKKTGGTSAQYLMADGSVSAGNAGTVTSVAATVPTGFAISGSPITSSGTLAISFASGYALPTTVKQSNWDDAYSWVAAFPTQTGNAGKYLTTDGTSLSWGTVTAGVSSFNTRTGAVTLSSTDVTNALGYTPVTNARTITINGTTQDLSANITFNTGGVTSFNTRTGAVTLSSSDVTTALGFTPVTQARTLTINGQAYDLSADRTWTLTPGSGMRNVTSYTATAGQTTFTITGGYTAGLIDIFLNGVRIPESDFTATNGTTVVFTTGVMVGDIVTAVLYTASATSGITGAGTANYLAKWSGTSAITNSLIFDNGINVGIGTATPTNISGYTTISLNNSTSGSIYELMLSGVVQARFFANATGSGIGSVANKPVSFITNDTEKMRLTAAGNLGIGTSSPAFQLDIVKSGSVISRVQNTLDTSDAAYMATNTAGTAQFGINYIGPYIYTSASLAIQLYTSGLERLRITPAGNIGIGTASPSFNLHVKGSDYGIAAIEAAATYNSQLRFHINGSILSAITAVSTSSSLIFYNNGSDRMTINSSGYVGIGTSSPVAMLSLPTNTSNSQISTGSIEIQSYAVNNAWIGDNIYFNGSGFIARNTGYTSQIYFGDASGIRFLTGSSQVGAGAVSNATERMRITPAGEVRIGLQSSTVTASLAVARDGGYPGDVSPAHLSLCGSSDSRMRISMGYSTTGNYGWINAGQWGVQWTSIYLQPSGGAVYAGSARIDNNSDIRVKDNIKPITGALNKVLSMNGKTFHMLDEPQEKIRFGFVAQELQGVVDELVIKSDRTQILPNGDKIENILGLETWGSSWAALLVEAIKEVDYNFETQADKIARLEKRVQQLEAK